MALWQGKLKIRRFTIPDLQAVMEIEQESYHNPWDEETFVRCIKEFRCIVATINRKIVGYSVFSEDEKGACILNLAVSPESKSMGVGRALFDHIKDRQAASGWTIDAIVHEENIDAQWFLRACGMRAVKVLKDYWLISDEIEGDAYHFQMKCEETEDCVL